MDDDKDRAKELDEPEPSLQGSVHLDHSLHRLNGMMLWLGRSEAEVIVAEDAWLDVIGLLNSAASTRTHVSSMTLSSRRRAQAPCNQICIIDTVAVAA